MDNTSNFYSYENALHGLENQLFQEKNCPTLLDQLNIQPNYVSVSGLKESDYPTVNEFIGTNLKVTKTLSIPIELQDRTKDMKHNCLMGVYAELDRLWLTVDSDLFLWNYEKGSDLAYYDSFTDTIIAAAFIKPRKGIFHPNIQYLFCIVGQIEIIILGVSVSGYKNTCLEFLSEPIFKLATDNEHISVIQDVNGRIIMGTKSGNILEVTYWSEKPSWLNFNKLSMNVSSRYAFENDNKLCSKLINHSVWKLSILLPSIIVNGLMLNEAIIQMVVDTTRNIVYTRSETSLIAQYELQPNDTIKRLNYITEDSIVSKASKNVKSVDKQNFRNIVEICPLTLGHGALQLMAVTKTGVRMYFTENLRLSHIRMPPVSHAALFSKINNVRLCCESRGTTVFVCGTSIDSQAIYTICPDSFILSELVETVSMSWGNNGSWLLISLENNDSKKQSSHPIMQTQHIDSLRKFLMISPESIIQLELPSPIHQLRSILENNSSPQCAQIKSWISHYGSEETIYVALVIASDTTNQLLSSRATEVVLYHLNESIKNRSLMVVSSCGKYTEQRNPLHQALYMYAARILRPLWDNCICEKFQNNNKDVFLVSSMDTDELKWYLHHLVHLHDFIRNNYPRLKSIDLMKLSSSSKPVVPLALELVDLLKASIEIVGLWRILSQHQLDLIMKFLTSEMQNEVLRCSIKQLLLPSKRPVLVSIISALLEYYLVHCSTTDTIIAALLDICPNIYRVEDAMCSRANEILVTIDNLTKDPSNFDEESLKNKKEQMLLDAVRLYQQVGKELDLGSIVGRLSAVGCLWGAVHLCLHVAQIRDPEQFSIVCLKDNHRPMNPHEIAAVDGRNDAYKYMIECLSTLLETSKCVPIKPSMNQGDLNGSNTLFQNYESTNSALNDLCIILSTIFDNKDDILAHYEVYSWMIDNGLDSDILKYNNTHLESYLMSRSDIDPQNITIKRLLWKFYEASGRLLMAARILDNMAVTECLNFSLSDRVESLSRAVVFVKAVVGENHSFEIDYLKELEDKLEIAQLQKVIIDEIGDENSTANIELNSRLFNIYTLLKDYAEPYELTVSKLFILRVSGQTDPSNIKLIWEDFIEREIEKLQDVFPIVNRQVTLKQTIMRVANYFKDSATFFPIDLILYHLESYCDTFEFPNDWAVSCLQAIDIPIVRIIQAYSVLLRMKDHDLKKHHNRIFSSLCLSFEIFLHSNFHSRENQIYCGQFLDIISMCLIQLQSRSDGNSHSFIERLRVYKCQMELRA